MNRIKNLIRRKVANSTCNSDQLWLTDSCLASNRLQNDQANFEENTVPSPPNPCDAVSQSDTTQSSYGESNATLKDQECGHYRPGFFFMKLNTDKKQKDFSTVEHSTFFHESIHFWQDISTVFGLAHLSYRTNYIIDCAMTVQSCTADAIRVPLKPADEVVKLNKDLFSCYLGDHESQFFDGEAKVVSIERNYETFLDDYPDLYYVQIDIEDASGRHFKKHFGYYAISETMAHLMEKTLFPTSAASTPEYPYKSAMMLAEFIAPGLSEKIVCAMCDACLQYHSPGAAYLEILEKVKLDGVCFNSVSEVYPWIFGNLGFAKPGGTVTAPELLKDRARVAEGCVKSLWLDEYLKPVGNFASKAIWAAVDLRLQRPEFMTRIFEEVTEVNRFSVFQDIVDELGTPLVFNNKEWLGISTPNPKLTKYAFYFPALFEVFQTICEGSSSCSLTGTCSTPYKKHVNSLCSNAPWKKTAENRLCPYAHIAKMLGLQGKDVILDSNASQVVPLQARFCVKS